MTTLAARVPQGGSIVQIRNDALGEVCVRFVA